MAFTQIKKQPSMTGIGAGNVATAEVPTTGTHYGLFLRCLTSAGADLTPAQIKADVGNIVIRLDGEQIIEASATFLLDLQKYYGDSIGAGNVNGIIPVYFAPAHLALFSERAVFALGTADINQFTIDANIVGVAQLSSIEVYSEVTNEVRNVGQHIRIKKFPQNFGTTGTQEITTLPKEGPSVGYRALHIEDNTGTIDKVTVKIGGNDIYDEVDDTLAQVLNERQKRTPQTGYYHVDFSRNNDLTSFLPMKGVQDFRQQIQWSGSAPNNFNIYAEQIHNLKTA